MKKTQRLKDVFMYYGRREPVSLLLTAYQVIWGERQCEGSLSFANVMICDSVTRSRSTHCEPASNLRNELRTIQSLAVLHRPSNKTYHYVKRWICSRALNLSGLGQLWGHSDLELLPVITKIKSVHPWVQVKACGKFEEIRWRHSWDITFTWTGRTQREGGTDGQNEPTDNTKL